MIESTIKARGKPKVKLPSLKQAANKKWEDMFAFQLKTAGLGSYFEREYIIPELGRKWRWDFCDPCPDRKVCIEVQGGIFFQETLVAIRAPFQAEAIIKDMLNLLIRVPA